MRALSGAPAFAPPTPTRRSAFTRVLFNRTRYAPLIAILHQSSRLPRSSSRRGHPTCTAILNSSSDEEAQEMAQRHHPALDAINDFTKWGVSAAAFGTLLLRRDVAACWCILGSVVAAVNCRLLKYGINQSRPEAARKADPGMPSSHANSLAFLATYVSVASAAAVGPQGPLGAVLVFGIPAAGIFLAWLRIALGYHTAPQVVVGWLVGSASAAWWWALGRSQLLPALQRHPQGLWWLYGATCAAVALFIVQNVSRWVREREHSHSA